MPTISGEVAPKDPLKKIPTDYELEFLKHSLVQLLPDFCLIKMKDYSTTTHNIS